MPIYDYHCQHCDKDFESLTRPNEPVQCPLCQSTHVDKSPAVRTGGHKWACKNEDQPIRPGAGAQNGKKS